MRKLPPTKICTFALVLGALALAAAPALADDEDDNGGLGPAPGGQVREFFVDLNNISWEIRPGVNVDIWAFSDTINPPTIPGPLIRVNKGDLVRVHFANTHARPHTLHFHGFHRNRVDGVVPVEPGEDFLYEWVANPAGTYVYHCHINTPVHQDRGMYAQFIVDDTVAEASARAMHGFPPVTREYLLVLDEHPRHWTSLGDDDFPATHEYVINGKATVPESGNPSCAGVEACNVRVFLAEPDGSFSVKSRMEAVPGQTVRLRIANFGMTPHDMEIVGTVATALFVQQGSDPFGVPRPTSVLPAELVMNTSLNLTFTAGPVGTYLFRSKRLHETQNAGVTPGGMQIILEVSP